MADNHTDLVINKACKRGHTYQAADKQNRRGCPTCQRAADIARKGRPEPT